MQDMQNVCIERKDDMGIVKYYYKGNKIKLLIIKSNESNKFNTSIRYFIEDLDKGKRYLVSDEEKYIISRSVNYTILSKGLQYNVLDEITSQNNNSIIEFSYIKDENINEKDCILVKEITYDKQEDGTYKNSSESEEDVRVYWIEKSTGFVLGWGTMTKTKKAEATPICWIYNITFDSVKDSDFDLPTGYTVYDRSE